MSLDANVYNDIERDTNPADEGLGIPQAAIGPALCAAPFSEIGVPQPAGGSREGISAHSASSLWTATVTGILVPVGGSIPLAPAPSRDYFATFRRFSRITLTSREIFNETPDLRIAEKFLTSGPLRFTLALLSRCTLTLANAKYEDLADVQRDLARAFLPQAALDRIDAWIRAHRSEPEVYFFSEQQLLTAMTLALGRGKRRRARGHEVPPFIRLGRALTHVVGFLDPLEEREALAESAEDARRKVIEAILRIGIFYNHEPYNHTISRYYEMLGQIAPRLAGDPDFIDVPRAFRGTTGICLKTYLQLGVVLLATVHAIASRRDGPPLLNLRSIRPRRHARRLWQRFMRQVMATPTEYRKQHRAYLRRSSLPHYNFLAAERRPLIALSKRVGCCLSLTFLERQFGVGTMHRVLEQMSLRQSGRFRRFFGRVFEVYVTNICGRTFGNLFVAGPRYGNNLEGGDGWILYPPKAILIEAKSGSVDLDTTLSGRLDGFERGFVKTMLGGARQLNRVIDDFRSRRFTVGGLGPDEIRIIFPVIVGLHYLPLDRFVWNYARSQLEAAGLLKQDAVRHLTIMAVKDLEQVEASSGGLLSLVEDRLEQEAWRDAPFSNFLYERRPVGGRAANEYLADRYKELLRGGASQLFHFALMAPEPES